MEEDLLVNMEDEDEEEDDEEEQGGQWGAGELQWMQEECVSSRSPAERSGHIAITDQCYMFVWGGYKNADGDATDLYLPKSEVWVFSMETRRWGVRRAEGDVPSSMSGSCAACVDGVLYVFGGHHARGNTNQVYCLPLRAPVLRWHRMRDLAGLAPTCKDKLGCWVHRNRLVYFGGYGYIAPPGHRGAFELDENSVMGNHAGRGWNNHIHLLDLETHSWTQPITKGNAPSPRAAHACATIANRGFVFGGRYQDHRLNDLYCINLDSWEWSEMCVPQHGPVGRSWHSLTAVSPDHLFLFGGFTTSRETLSDAWIYCISENQWKPFKHEHTEQPRLWHTACLGADGEVFVFGGCANNLLSHQQAAHSNELLIFTVQPKPLLRLCVDVAVQHRSRLQLQWDVLPKALLLQLQRRRPVEP